MISPTTRSGKGSELSWAELDANFTAIAAAVNFLLPVDTSFATAIPFTGNLYMPQQTVSSVLAFTAAGGALKGAHVYVRLVADGTHAPTFTGIKEWGGSSGYDNRAGITNELEFFFDGADFWYCFSQAVGASATDTTAPTASSSQVANAAPTVVVITMSESLDSGYTPATSAFSVSGHTVSSVSISGSTISVTVSSAFVNGEAARTVSYTQPGSNQARDAAGNLLASFASLAITNNVAGVSTVPGAPTIGTATEGNASASVTFTFPASDGGATITGYTVTSSPGGVYGTGSVSPITVSGLTNGTAYTFTVTATNSVGTGAASAASNSVTPSATVTAPSQVTGLTLGTPTSSTQPLTWTPPSNGGSALTDYIVEWAIAASGVWNTFADGTSTTASATVTGLASGTSYDYRVAAVNAIGQGAYSATQTGATSQNIRGNSASYIGSVSESGSDASGWTYTSGTTAQSFAEAVTPIQSKLPVGAIFISPYSTSTDFALIGISTSSSIGSYSSVSLNGLFRGQATGTYQYISNGSGVTDTSVTNAAGDIVRIRRVSGTSVVAELSRDSGATWPTTLKTWTISDVTQYVYFYPFDSNSGKNTCGPINGIGMTT